MSALGTVGIAMNKIPKEAVNEKGYLNLDYAINDETGQYGDNVSFWVRQSKEERESGAARVYVGNGRIVYTKDGVVTVAEKQEQQVTNAKFNEARTAPAAEKSADLPF